MKKIVKHRKLKVAIYLIVGLLISFFATCILVGSATPHVYEFYETKYNSENNINQVDSTKDQEIQMIQDEKLQWNEILSQRGLFGDSAGFVSAIFALLAFLGVAYSLIKQQEVDVLSTESQFSTEFFNMLNLFAEIRNNLYVINQNTELDGGGLYEKEGSTTCAGIDDKAKDLSIIRGVDVFRYVYSEQLVPKPDETDYTIVAFSKGLKGYINDCENPERYPKEKIQQLFFNGPLDSYFIYGYRILKFIQESDIIDAETKNNYYAIFRAQLSEYELLLLYFNALNTKIDGGKYKLLIEDTCQFNNIRYWELPTKLAKRLHLRFDDNFKTIDINEEYEYKSSAFTKMNLDNTFYRLFSKVYNGALVVIRIIKRWWLEMACVYVFLMLAWLIYIIQLSLLQEPSIIPYLNQ